MYFMHDIFRIKIGFIYFVFLLNLFVFLFYCFDYMSVIKTNLGISFLIT